MSQKSKTGRGTRTLSPSSAWNLTLGFLERVVFQGWLILAQRQDLIASHLSYAYLNSPFQTGPKEGLEPSILLDRSCF